VQEAFCRLSVEEPPPALPVPWLYRVCRNVTEKQRLSDRRRRRREEARASIELVHLDPAERLEMAEVLNHVEALDPDLRQVLIARIWGELSLDEVASLCGISTTTAFRRYHSALNLLRFRLEAKCKTSS
jgi:RNA polymerase sigma-70 factor (ECF subfamily)